MGPGDEKVFATTSLLLPWVTARSNTTNSRLSLRQFFSFVFFFLRSRAPFRPGQRKEQRGWSWKADDFFPSAHVWMFTGAYGRFF